MTIDFRLRFNQKLRRRINILPNAPFILTLNRNPNLNPPL